MLMRMLAELRLPTGRRGCSALWRTPATGPPDTRMRDRWARSRSRYRVMVPRNGAIVPTSGTARRPTTGGGAYMNGTQVGVDLAKAVCEVAVSHALGRVQERRR